MLVVAAAVVVLAGVSPLDAHGSPPGHAALADLVLVTITAASPTIVRGQPVPTIGFTSSGDVVGLAITTPTCAAAGGALPAAATYPTWCTGPATDANYRYTYLGGSLTVTRAATTTALASSVSGTVVGQPVTLTATVTTLAPGSGFSGAGVLFQDGATVLGASAPVAGVATLTTAGLALGPHTITAASVGGPSYASSTSASITVTVGSASTITSLTWDPAIIVTGQPVTFTATVRAVSPGVGVPGAGFTFSDGATKLATVASSNGKATFASVGLAGGTHTITATFLGGPNYASSSATANVTVLPAATTTVLTASTTSIVVGQNVTLTATVATTAPGAGTPPAIISFMEGSKLLAAVAPVGGVTSFTTPGLLVGPHTLTATFSGGPNYQASTSAPMVVTVVSCGCDWSQFRGDPTHQGSSATETLLSGDRVSGLTGLWTTYISAPELSSPTVANGVLYIGGFDHMLHAFNASTGATIWAAVTGGNVHSSPAVANGVVYVGSDDGTVRAFDAITGAPVWLLTTGGVVDSSPTVSNGVAYIGSGDGRVYAIDAITGVVRWTMLTGGPVHPSPTPADGFVFVGANDGRIYALDASTGAVQWSVQTGSAVVSSSTVANGLLYTTSDDGRLWVLRETTGALVWYADTGAILEASPALANGVVYVGNTAGKEMAYDAVTGVLLWTVQTGGEIHSSAAVALGVVYFGSFDAKFYALDAATGATLWSTNMTYPVSSSPAIANGVVYVGGWDHSVRAFSVPH